MAKKLKVMTPANFAYYHQKLLDYIGTLPWGPTTPSGMAALFDIALPDEFYISSDGDAIDAISSGLNLDGFQIKVGTSGISWRKPTIQVPALIPWGSSVDENYNLTANVTVGVLFADGSGIQKNVRLIKPGEGKLYACRLSDITSRVDTGIAADYAYRFHVKGHTYAGNMCVLADAYASNTARTTARILGGSQKIQSMWYTNREITNANFNWSKMFEMTVGANYAKVTQSGTTYAPTITGHVTSGAVGTNISLLGSAASGYGNGILSFAEILDGNGDALAYFAPYKIEGVEVVLLNTLGLTPQEIYDIVQNGDSSAYASGRIFRPLSGYLVEVTQAEDDAM